MLRHLLKDENATWSCKEQLEGLKAILALRADVLVIMGTGSGKTMLALLPVLLEPDQASVVVLPLKSLMTDYKRRLKNLGINFEHYTGAGHGPITGNCNFILVSADVAIHDHWKQALDHFNRTYFTVVRLFFDEGHYAITSNDYRPALRQVFTLRTLPIQLVIFSGSIPPISEPAIHEAFGLQPETIVIRSPTHRPELQLNLSDYQYGWNKVIKEIRNIIFFHKEVLEEGDRILVFVPFVSEGQKVADALESEFYVAKIDDQIKERIYYQWIEGTNITMVCTSAFGAGNDYPSVRLVIHAGTPQEMIGFIQEISRGGRDKNPASCYIIPHSKTQPRLDSSMIDHKGQQAIWNMLFANTDCLRFAITAFNDGRGIYCKDYAQNQWCSRCRKTYKPKMKNPSVPPVYSNSNCSPGVVTAQTSKPTIDTSKASPACPPDVGLIPLSFQQPSASYQLQKSQSKRKQDDATSAFQGQFQASKLRKLELNNEDAKYVETFKKALSHFMGLCIICVLHDHNAKPHAIVSCPTLKAYGDNAVDEYRRWKEALIYRKDSKICFYCHIPQCDDRLHCTFARQGGACDHEDVVPGLVYLIMLKEKTREAVQKQFGLKNLKNPHDFVKWLNGLPIKGEKSNLTAVFLWYIRTFYK